MLKFPSFEIIETVISSQPTAFPYIPGLLSFREMPVILESIKKLKNIPDLFLIDGQGQAHPRGMGLACHLGLFTDKPCIGSAKSHLYGKFERPENKKGTYSLLFDKYGKKIGAVLRSKDNTKPIYVSPGHLIDIDSSIK